VGESSRRSLLVSVADFRQGSKQPECHRFTASQVIIGRSTDSDLVLDHPSVSKQHARVEWNGKDLVITDLDSRNGVYVNGNRLQQPYTLKGVEEVYVGTFVLSFGADERSLSGWGIQRSNGGGGLRPARLYIGYAQEDAAYREALRTHLRWLQRDGLIFAWHDHVLTPNTARVQRQIDELSSADAIVLLLSPDYLRSEHSTTVEMKRALEQARSGKSCVLPVLLRPVYLRGGPFDGIELLPKNGKPVSGWEDQDAAWVHIVDQIRSGLRDWAISRS